MARVGNSIITIEDFENRVRQFDSSTGQLEQVAKEKILNTLIERQLLLNEAVARNLMVNETELNQEMQRVATNYPGQEFEKMLTKRRITDQQWRDNLKEVLLTRKVFNHLTHEPIEISEETIKNYYQENISNFTTPEQVRALHILVSSEQTAFDVLAQLRKNRPFETVARENSLGPEAERGGDLGYFSAGIMPEIFDDVIFNLKVGKISRVVSSEHGYHIFKLIDRKAEHQKSLDECREDIRAQLTKANKQALYSNWLKQQLEKTKIYKNPQLLARL